MFYGRALKEPDGSYVVTEWVTLLWLPILPLGSKRVWFESYEKGSFWSHPVTRYQTQTLQLYWPQVAWGYAITFGIFGLLSLIDAWDEYWFVDNASWLLPVGVVLAAACTFAFLRFRRPPKHKVGGVTSANWDRPGQLALLSGAGIGAAVGVAIGYALTSEGASFFSWMVDQRYFDWAAIGWGVFGSLVGGALVFVTKLLK